MVVEPTILFPLKTVLQTEYLYFRSGYYSADEAAAVMLSDAQRLGGPQAKLTLHEGWHEIENTNDWLTHPRWSATELFRHVIPAPELGPNRVRSEVLLTVFADTVITAYRGRVTQIKGTPTAAELERAAVASQNGRVVGFR